MGIGLRGGLGYGLTFKKTLGNSNALELIADSWWRGFVLTGLYEMHRPFFDVEGMTWYFGGGAHIGFFRGWSGNPWFYKNTNSYTLAGVDGVIGVEYDFRTISEVPFTVGLDWIPTFNFIGYTGFWGNRGSLAIRYVF